MPTEFDDTIFALSSAPGKAAVAVVRISGPAAAEIGRRVAAPLPAPRKASLRALRHPATGAIIDTALVIFFSAPASATGDDLLELHVHGGRAVLQALFEVLAGFAGCRMAEPGEFSRRAFENGKLDLTAVEGIADLIDAETEAQRRQAQRQAGGGLARLYDGWRTEIIAAQALVEAAIDFSDEADVAADAIERAAAIAGPLSNEIAQHLEGAARGEIVRSGFQVAIAGPPNAGKSSLLNALARRDAAIVSDEAGTTRDVVEVHLDLDGLAVIVSDTAGIRETDSKVEKEGIRRAIERARSADLVIWLDSIDVPAAPPEEFIGAAGTRLLRATNKIDLQSAGRERPEEDGGQLLSLNEGTGVDALVSTIVAAAQASVGTVDDPVPTNARQKGLLQKAHGHLRDFLTSPRDDTELRAEDLRLAAQSIGRITGRIDVEDVLDQIFSRFCIGK